MGDKAEVRLTGRWSRDNIDRVAPGSLVRPVIYNWECVAEHRDLGEFSSVRDIELEGTRKGGRDPRRLPEVEPGQRGSKWEFWL